MKTKDTKLSEQLQNRRKMLYRYPNKKLHDRYYKEGYNVEYYT